MDCAEPPPLRAPQGERLRLGLGNLLILPSRHGWLWLAVVVLLQLIGIRLGSNTPLLLSDLMLGMLLLVLHLTHLNLQGVELAVEEPQPGFAGSPLVYPLLLHCRGRCEGLRLGFRGEPACALPPLQPGRHHVHARWTPAGRGLQRPGTLRLETSAPLGLFVCWIRWQPTIPQLVYPVRRHRKLSQRRHEN